MRTEGKGDNQKIVFVDCFNTIIGRTKTPNDVLYDWGLEMNKKFNKCSAINFFRLFKRSWRNLKRFDVIEKENSEFLMDIKSIFNEVFEDFKKITEENISENEFIDIAYDTYFMAEHGSHFLKQKTVKYLYAKKQQGCKIFLVSDFYCDKEEIVKWLEKLGLDCSYIFDDVFVSCDLKKSKKTGSIYHEIIDIKKLNHKNITMVGDNFWSDGIMASKAGLKTKSVFSMFRQDCKILRRSKMPIEVPKEYMDIFNNNISDTTYSNYAFLLFLFAKRLAQSCERKGIKNLFFLAREGKFLKTIFDYYCSINNIDIATHYLFVSRKSVINTSSQDYDKSFAGLSATPFMTCQNFLKSLSFDNDEIKSIMRDAKITYKGPHLKFNKSRAYRLLLNSKQFEIRYQKIRKEQRASYTNYLNSFNVDICREGFYIVDSGWLGNMQRYMGNYFDREIDLQGFYIGIINKNSVNKKLFGLLFAKKLKGLNYFDKICSYRRFNWEEFLRAETGSCVGYDKDTNLPMLAKAEGEAEGYYKYVKMFQTKIYEKFKQITELYKTCYCDIDAVATYMCYQMVKNTNKSDRKLFVGMQDSFFDGFGHFNLNVTLISGRLRKFVFFVKDKWFLLKNHRIISKRRSY